MDALKVFAICVFLLVLLFLALSERVSRYRRTMKIPYSRETQDRSFAAAISAQSNFANYVPFALLLLALLINTTVNYYLFLLMCLGLLVGRFVHAYGLLYAEQAEQPNYLFRSIGMIITGVVLLLSALCMLFYVF